MIVEFIISALDLLMTINFSNMGGTREGYGVRTPPPPPGKSQVAIGFLRNTCANLS